jgi:integrase/recombinase XerD
MSKDLKPLAPIAIRFQHDLKINGKGERTQQSYVRMLRKFSEFLGADPDSASEEDLRRYFLHISENQLWKPSTINVAYQALKQFFRRTCPRDWKTLQFVRVQVEQKIPTVLSVAEVHTFLKLVDKPSMHCLFYVVYAMGLRLQEALHLPFA